MSDVLQPEIASAFGCLDTNAALDGDAGHAHALRALARSTNRLIQQSSPLLNVAFDASTDTAEIGSGACAGYFSFYEWRRVIPGPVMCPKKPNHAFVDGRLIANIPADQTLTVQVETGAARFERDTSTDRPNVFALDGTGAWEIYELDGIPASAEDVEPVNVFFRGMGTATTADSSTYGSPTSAFSGEFWVSTERSKVEVPTASWNLASASNNLGAASRFAVQITDYQNDFPVLPEMKIMGVWSATELLISTAPMTGRHVYLYNESASPTYKLNIITLSQFRAAGLALYSRGPGG